METHYPDTIRQLVDAYSRLTPELKKAARYMVEHPEEVGLNSMRRVARAADVKPATITRLTKTLGFETYADLREPFRQRLRRNAPDYAMRLQGVKQRAESGAAIFDDLRAQEVANIEQSLSEENRAVIEAAAETLHNSRRLYVLGLRGAHAPAFLFHYSYRFFQDNSVLLNTSAGIFADPLRAITAADSLLAISFTPYTQSTIDAVEYAAKASAKIIAVTDSIVSPVASHAIHTIVTRTQSPSFYHSFTGALSITQALITLLATRSGGDALQIIKETERHLAKISAYW